MKKIPLFIACISILVAGCKKDSSEDTPTPTAVSEQDVLDDFVDVLVNPTYADLQSRANGLNQAILTLSASTTSANLSAAQQAWRDVRVPWELSEGFLFGPVEDFNYDPATDSWPVNTVELDSLLASSNPLTEADIELLQDALKGYHPIEYVLFGVGGSRTVSELGGRELQYLISLSANLDSVVNNLKNDWIAPPVNFGEELRTAGHGSTRFTTRKDAFRTIVDAMEHICNEVSSAKMEDPLSQLDSTIVESQYAHNATTDFTNNIIGLQNVYMGTYGGHTGHSLHHLVSAKNGSLDNEIQSQINTAIASLQTLDQNYGVAIFTQQGQIIATQQAINDLHDKLDLLMQFVETYIND